MDPIPLELRQRMNEPGVTHWRGFPLWHSNPVRIATPDRRCESVSLDIDLVTSLRE